MIKERFVRINSNVFVCKVTVLEWWKVNNTRSVRNIDKISYS